MLIVWVFCILKACPICCSVCSASQEIRVTRLRNRQQTLLGVASAGLLYWVAQFFLLGTKARILGLTLAFQVAMHYCSLQHRTLLPSPVTSTTRFRFCFGSVSFLFLELFLHWSPVAYWAPTDLGSSSFSVLSFHLVILFMWFSRQD